LAPFWPELDIKKWPDIGPTGTGTGYPVHPYLKGCLFKDRCIRRRGIFKDNSLSVSL